MQSIKMPMSRDGPTLRSISIIVALSREAIHKDPDGAKIS